MSYAIYQTIQTDIQTLLRSLSLTDLDPADIKVRSMPKVAETLDRTPCIIVAPYGSVRNEPLDFEGNRTKTYQVEIAVVAKSFGDYQTNQPKYLGWIEQIDEVLTFEIPGTIRQTLPSLPNVYGITIEEEPTFDRTKLNQQYAYQSLLLSVESQERR